MMEKFLKGMAIFVLSANALGTTINETFRIGILSDTQFYRALHKGIEVGEHRINSKESNEENRNNVNNQNFRSVIINGDLTEFGHPYQRKRFADYVNKFRSPVYLGLGNHDYANNVDDCGLPFSDQCAYDMVKYFEEKIRDLPDIKFDFDGSAGSLAYSWDIADVHFVQLNNYLDYTVELSAGKWGWGFFPLNSHLSITPSYNWLRDDLGSALENGAKVIILNMHDVGDNMPTDNPNFVSILEDFPITAIFAGHLHTSLGRQNDIEYGDNKKVALFRSGASFRKNFLEVNFESSQMTVTAYTGLEAENTDVIPYAPYATKKFTKPIKNIYLSTEESCSSGDGQPVNTLDRDSLSGDLNQDAGGEYIYLCQSTSGDNTPISDILLSESRNSPEGYSIISAHNGLNSDLNEGARGKEIFIHYRREDSSKPIGNFLISESDVCPNEYQRAEQSDGLNGDLNQGSKGRYIYLCYIRIEPTGDDSDSIEDLNPEQEVVITPDNLMIVNFSEMQKIVASGIPEGWTPARVVFAFSSLTPDNSDMSGLKLEGSDGIHNLQGHWQRVDVPFNPDGMQLNIPAGQVDREIQLQIWYEG